MMVNTKLQNRLKDQTSMTWENDFWYTRVNGDDKPS
jgi:hypothetical protein